MPRVRLPIRLHAARTPDDDRSLIARFSKARDEAAFAALLGRHARMVYGVCKRAVRDAHLAEDAFQAVFLVLSKNPDAARDAASVGGWLFGVARRVGLAARRHEHSRARRQLDVEPAGEAPPAADFDELLSVLDEELARLPEAYRAPLVACFLEERTQDEAARQLGWSLSTLRRRLERGKELLRGRLTRRGATLAGGLFANVLAPSASGAVPRRLLEAAGAASAPSLRASALAAEVAGRSLVAKALVGVAAFAAVLGGIAVGLAGEQPESNADPRPAAPAVRPDVAVAPRPTALTPWVTVTGRVVYPEERDFPELQQVKGLRDADFFTANGPVFDRKLVVNPKNRGLANAVVWLRPDSDDRDAPFPKEKIHPVPRAAKPTLWHVTAGTDGFVPRVTAARAGDRLSFDNPTPIPFNVRYTRYWTYKPPMGGETGEFNVLLPTERSHETTALPVTRSFDNFQDSIHPWVKGYVWAFDHPYSCVTDEWGTFTLPDAPAGNWRLVVWHEQVGYRHGLHGKLGEPIRISGNSKMSLGNVAHATPAWNMDN